MEQGEKIYRNCELSEKALERRLVKEVKKLGFLSVKMQDPMNGGLPDRLIVIPGGRVVWVELKSRGKKPTLLQESRIKNLNAYGHVVFVADSREDIDEVIDYISLYRLAL